MYRKNRYNQHCKFPCNWGVSGALNLQSAIAGVLPCRGLFDGEPAVVSGDDARVLRNRNLRTVSGQE